MIVSRLACQNWRNIEACSISLNRGINVLWGMNAQGKSNILESIYYFARGRSFRGAKDRELVRFGCDFSSSLLDYRRDGYAKDTRLEATILVNGKKKLLRNDAPLTASEMMGSFRAVLFCPSNLTIVSGGPGERRTFLDIALSQLSPQYLTYLRRYSKLLNERNALLKRAGDGMTVAREEWEVYAESLGEYGAWIACYRNEYVDMLGESVSRYFSGMTDGKEIPKVRYTSHALCEEMPNPLTKYGQTPTEEMKRSLTERLLCNMDRETAAGTTLWGVHKDDIQLTLNEKEAKLYASQGQQRSFVLSMKLAEAEIASRIGGEFPVILLDDVFSELDETRRAYILKSLGDEPNRQIIITSCEPDVIPESFGNVNFLRVENGSVMTADADGNENDSTEDE